MPSQIKNLFSKNLLDCPAFVAEALQYETIMGSESYGVSSASSDIDLYGFCFPPQNYIFPHKAGVILGFDKNYPIFNNYTKHHVLLNDNNYDISVYGIVNFFRLCADANPNMIDCLFTPARCKKYLTPVASHVIANRKLFLSKKCFHTLKGYAYQQLHKIRNKPISQLVADISLFEEKNNIPRTTSLLEVETEIARRGLKYPGTTP